MSLSGAQNTAGRILRIKVGRWNERVRAKRCDAVVWDSAEKYRLFWTSVRACDVVCPLDTAAVTELWRLDLFLALLPGNFVLVRCLRMANVAIFCRRLSWSRQTSLSKVFSYYLLLLPWLYRWIIFSIYFPMSMLFQNKNNYSRLPITRTLANSNQNRFPLDFRHTFTVILPSVTRTAANSNQFFSFPFRSFSI